MPKEQIAAQTRFAAARAKSRAVSEARRGGIFCMRVFGRKKICEHDLALYGTMLACCLLLSFTGGQGEPFSLPLLFAMLTNGLSLPLSCLFFLAAGALTLSVQKFVVYGCQAFLLFVAFFLFRRLGGKNRILHALAALLCLPFFVLLFPLEPYPFLSFLTPLLQKLCIAAALFLLCLLFDAALRIILEKLTRCRLSREELLCIAVFLGTVGSGLYHCGGALVYFSAALFCILLYTSLLKNAGAVVFALLCALPPALREYSAVPFALYALYAGMALFFLPSGKFSCVLAVAFAYTAVQFFFGLYTEDALQISLTLLACVLPCTLFLCIPVSVLKAAEKKLILYRENHLSRIAINRNRAAIGEKLYALANVFRRIENTFEAISRENRDGDENARAHIRERIGSELCAACPNLEKCRGLGMESAFDMLIAVGCAKGKAGLIDLPAVLSANCTNAGGVLFCLNKQLAEYRKYILEAENARSGRALMASQAQGVGEILKNIALEQSQPLSVCDEKERALFAALAKKGIVCSEILVYGDEENIFVSLTVFGARESAKIVKAAEEVLGMPLMTGEKLVLSKDKFCYTLRKKPYFDAAFGVASARKKGESQSGDTHSVIRIDEKRFLAALSDGMGSGPAAKRISESALSLLESFYRAGMPGDTILSTVNKLLTFNREESFACIDLAVVDLDSGRADVVKVGSPLGCIFSEGTIRVLEGESLPLGMLDELRPATLSVQLQENDILVFFSDGITDAFGSSSDLFDYLKTLDPLNPQTLADDILHAALRRTNGVPSDDMTVLAVRIFRAA